MKALSPRECEVIQLLVGGLTRKEVACRLGVSMRTVTCYLSRVRAKTEMPTILSAVAYVVKNGMVLVNSA